MKIQTISESIDVSSAKPIHLQKYVNLYRWNGGYRLGDGLYESFEGAERGGRAHDASGYVATVKFEVRIEE